MDPEIGSSYGPYLVEEVIARGGQGLVLKTRHSQRGVPAALKILLDKGDLARGRFLREIETLRLLADHPGLPTPYDLGEHEGTLFIALELVEGPSLQDLVRSGGPLAEPSALRLVAKIARVVAQCHERGVLHRDLKPANVIQRASGAPCVVDFGVARVEGVGVSEGSRLSLTGDLIGTPAYMAPEQVSGEGVGHQTDVYGLGAILFFLLSGQKPVSGATSINVLTRLARDPTPDVRQANPAVSAATAEILLQAMAKDPAERIQSAEVFAEHLDALTRDEGEEGSRLPLLLLAAAAIGFLALALTFVIGRGSEPTTTPASTPPKSVATPRASRTPPRAQAPGTPAWATTFEGFAVVSHAPLGPWALVETAPLIQGLPKHKQLQTRLVSLDDGSLGPKLPRAALWCWDPSGKRAIGHSEGRLFSVSGANPTPAIMAEEVGTLCSLGTANQRIYTSLPHLFQIRDLRGKVLREVSIPGHSEAPPLSLDLDPAKPGPDHLLVVTTDSAALLLTLDGRLRSTTDLPGPVAMAPVVLRAQSESAEIGLVSGAGILTRLEARSRNLRILGSWSLGELQPRIPFEPRGPLLVDRDPEGAPRRVFLHLLRGVACLSPDLSTLRWRAEHPAGLSQFVVAGLSLGDLDRDTEPELLATFVRAGRKTKRGPRELVHLLLGAEGRAFSSGSLRLSPWSADSTPDGSLLLTQATDTLVRWGPWTGLPSPDPSLSGRVKRPPRELRRPGPLQLPAGKGSGKTAELPLTKTAEKPPFSARFDVDLNPKVPVRVVGTQGLESVWVTGQFYRDKDQVLCTEARFDVNFLFVDGQRPKGDAWLEIDLLARPNFGPAFVEFAFVVNGQPRTRTVRAFHRKGVLKVHLGEVNEAGLCEIKIYVTPRTRVVVQVKSFRLTFSEG